MSSKSSYTQKGGNPEVLYVSPTKQKGELSTKNSKLFSFSASPSYHSELTIEKLPSSLPEFSLQPSAPNSIVTL
jgi:hypothetical protein